MLLSEEFTNRYHIIYKFKEAQYYNKHISDRNNASGIFQTIFILKIGDNRCYEIRKQIIKIIDINAITAKLKYNIEFLQRIYKKNFEMQIVEEQCSKRAKYSPSQDTFEITRKLKDSIPLRKNFLEMKQLIHHGKKQENEDKFNDDKEPLYNPLAMHSTMYLYLFVEKIILFLSCFTFLVSLYHVYGFDQKLRQEWINYEDTEFSVYLLSSVLAMLLVIAVITSHCLNIIKQKARNNAPDLDLHELILKILIFLPHPTVWTLKYNNFMHLFVSFRLIYSLTYFIRSSIFYDSRGHRLIGVYGIHSKDHFFFSFKSMIQQTQIHVIICFYVSLTLFFSHCLYLISSQAIPPLSFSDCFEIVIVSMPTVGYGEENIDNIYQKIIIIVVVITGAVMNSFITLSMLNSLQMFTRQQSSYNLLRKLQMHQRLKILAQNYIRDTFLLIKKKSYDIQLRQELDFTFRDKFRQAKAVYDLLNLNDIDKNFTFFKQSLHELNIKNVQTNNMLDVWLRKIIKSRRQLDKRSSTGRFRNGLQKSTKQFSLTVDGRMIELPINQSQIIGSKLFNKLEQNNNRFSIKIQQPLQQKQQKGFGAIFDYVESFSQFQDNQNSQVPQVSMQFSKSEKQEKQDKQQ